MTVTADKSALAELVESFVAMKDLWLIFGIMIEQAVRQLISQDYPHLEVMKTVILM